MFFIEFYFNAAISQFLNTVFEMIALNFQILTLILLEIFQFIIILFLIDVSVDLNFFFDHKTTFFSCDEHFENCLIISIIFRYNLNIKFSNRFFQPLQSLHHILNINLKTQTLIIPTRYKRLKIISFHLNHCDKILTIHILKVFLVL